MTTDTFRQDRRPQDNQNNLNKIYEVQKSAGVQVPNDVRPPISGNVPPQVQEIFNKTANVAAPTSPTNFSEIQAMQNVMQTSKLQELLDGAKKYTHKWEEVLLPSIGKFYNGTDGPVDGVIHIRPMTGDEEDILANPRMTRKTNYITDIFSRCIKEKFNTDNFLVEDRHYLLIFLRGISFGPDYDAEITCTFCSGKFQTTIDLDQDVQLNMCPDNCTLDSLKEKFPVTGYNFSYRFQKASDELMLANYRNKKVQDFGSSNDDLTFKLSLYVEEIEGVSDQRSIHMLLKQLPVNDINYVRDLVFSPPFGVDTEIQINCPMCQSDIKVDLPMGLNFFFPKGKRATKQV